MTIYIPRTCNSTVARMTGDGFFTVKSGFLDKFDVVVVKNKAMMDQYQGECTVITQHQVPSFIKSGLKYRRVIIDIRLPRPGTKSLEAIAELCVSKVVSFFEQPYDMLGVSSALYVLNKTASNKLVVVNFNMFQHLRQF